MYQPPHFREDRPDIRHGLIRAHPLGLLVTAGKAGPVADPIPLILDEAARPEPWAAGDAPPESLVAQGRANCKVSQVRPFDPLPTSLRPNRHQPRSLSFKIETDGGGRPSLGSYACVTPDRSGSAPGQ